MNDTSKIDRLELRQQIAALDEARKPLAEAAGKIDAEKWKTIDAEIDRERAIYERERNEADAAFWKRCQEIRAAHGETADDPEQALEAHDQHPAYNDVMGYDDHSFFALRCCVSGLVLLEDDEVVEDSLGRKALAAALPGWPVFAGDAQQEDAA